jgi:hypothetical protein
MEYKTRSFSEPSSFTIKQSNSSSKNIVFAANKNNSCNVNLYDFYLERADGAFTVNYVPETIPNRVDKFIQCNTTTFADKQLKVVASFVEELELFSSSSQMEIIITLSEENEICISVKKKRGYTLFAVDTDGDSMYSFIGLEKGDDTLDFFTFEEFDSETAVYKFLSK